MTKFDNPCKRECPNRTATCKFDGLCSKYQEWKSSYEHDRACIRKITEAEGMCIGFLAHHKKRRASELSIHNNMKGTR